MRRHATCTAIAALGILTATGCSSSPAAKPAATASATATSSPISVNAILPSDMSPSSPSAAPAETSTAAASPAVSDNPALDLTGSGTDCTMTYQPGPNNSTLTVITVTEPGEIMTHASDTSGNLTSHDVEITQGPNAFSYPIPLSQVDDLGAVFYPDGAASQSCTIEPAQ